MPPTAPLDSPREWLWSSSMVDLDAALLAARDHVARIRDLDERYRAGQIQARVPSALAETDRRLDDLLEESLPASHAALEAASRSLFFSLPVAFDPAESVGPYLATADRDARGEPYRFLDMGALIATQAFGENEPAIVAAVLRDLPFVASRYAHSEYQTVLSLKLKARLDAIAPSGTPRHFVVNTGAEAVENAIKATLLNRVRTSDKDDGPFFVISFDGAFHGRTLGCLAVTQRRKARVGFPTFDWPHVTFPFDDARDVAATALREETSLTQLWELLHTGRVPNAPRPKEVYARDLAAIDAMLSSPADELAARLVAARSEVGAEALARARRVAAVLIEPIQGEGGVRMARPSFFRRLRLLTSLYGVPLVFDEVQTGWGATGAMWAHDRFELPLPPDAVLWAKKAQNGVLFVSEELATFFQEEKKFNTTWEGDSVGMIRLLAILDRLDLAQVQRTGALAREGLDAIAREFGDFVQGVRGVGCMLAFDVVRPDWRDALRDRAFRLGLLLLPAGERTLRVYPRYDTEPYAVREAISILRRAIEDIVSGRALPGVTHAPERRVGALDVPREGLEVIDLRGPAFAKLKQEVMTLEVERYGSIRHYPVDVLREGRRPLLQYPEEALDAAMSSPRSCGVALRDGVSRRLVAYAIGGPLEAFDEEGVRDDGQYGAGTAFYLMATATHPSTRNETEITAIVLDAVRAQAEALGYSWFSTLIEARAHATGPAWLREAAVLRTVESYLGSGISFVYARTAFGAV